MAVAAPVVVEKTLRRVFFRLSSQRVPRAASVVLVGTFNQWDASAHRLELGRDGWWKIFLTLAPGVYPYLFIVDGVPWNDPEDDGRVACEWGGQYSLRVVG